MASNPVDDSETVVGEAPLDVLAGENSPAQTDVSATIASEQSAVVPGTEATVKKKGPGTGAKKRGRPKAKANPGASAEPAPAAPRKRGRPPGSGKKAAAKKVVPAKAQRGRPAKAAAAGSSTNSSTRVAKAVAHPALANAEALVRDVLKKLEQQMKKVAASKKKTESVRARIAKNPTVAAVKALDKARAELAVINAEVATLRDALRGAKQEVRVQKVIAVAKQAEEKVMLKAAQIEKKLAEKARVDLAKAKAKFEERWLASRQAKDAKKVEAATRVASQKAATAMKNAEARAEKMRSAATAIKPEKAVKTPGRRGRPPKAAGQEAVAKPPARRGRPPKKAAAISEAVSAAPVGRKRRGRPPKQA